MGKTLLPFKADGRISLARLQAVFKRCDQYTSWDNTIPTAIVCKIKQRKQNVKLLDDDDVSDNDDDYLSDVSC